MVCKGMHQHYRVGAAMLFPGGAIIIVIFLALDPVCFSRHAVPTAPADQDTGKQIHCISLGRSPGIQSADTLDQLKILLGNQRLMGVRDANPFRGWPLLHLLDFVVWGALLALYQCADVGFILQNADDCCSRPLAILFVGIAMFGIGKTKAERFIWHHPLLGFFFIFIGMPLFVLLGVCISTIVIAFPMAWLFGWL